MPIMDDLNREAIESWRRCFESMISGGSGADIFEIAEAAISVAAFYCPGEFFRRRDTIAQLLFAKRKTPKIHCQLNSAPNVSFSSTCDDEYGAEQVDQVPLLTEEPSCGCEANVVENEDHDDDDDVLEATQTKTRRGIKIKIKRNKEKQVNKKERSDQFTIPETEMMKSIVESPKKISTGDGKGKEHVSRHIAGATEAAAAAAAIIYEKNIPDPREKVDDKKAKECSVPGKVVVVALNVIAESTKKKNNNNNNNSNNKIRITDGPAKQLNEQVALELKFDATKRKFQQEYKRFDSSKKKIRMIDLDDLPTPQQQQQQQKVGTFGCRNKYRRKP